jgi:hypothetical protein
MQNRIEVPIDVDKFRYVMVVVCETLVIEDIVEICSLSTNSIVHPDYFMPFFE